ncbi:MAG: TIGR01777 family oxidoreductase, partial [Methylococcales bacterium]|nr:TIGR01777 family oxidoreductase [Methylococcales bacterium]
KILITGGTGFIGKSLCRKLLENNDKLTVLSRRPEKVPQLCGKTTQAISSISDLTTEEHFDAIINLAGEGIADARWTSARKQKLLDSRIKTTEQLIAFIDRATEKPKVLISGSAVGFYGNQGDKQLDENSAIHDDFAHQLCARWEAAAKAAEAHGVRVCIIRTGLVIGNDGGFLKRMLPAFKLGMGGPLGDGRQWMSWIHRTDFIAIIDKLLESKVMQGIFNATAPEPVSNAEFSQALGNVLNRPTFIPVPAFVLKTLLGEMSELLLGGQRVLPERIEQAGFKFQFKTLEQALKDVL